jgi:hypothetical protein
MEHPQVRIFPHDTKEEFRSEDLLRMWLLNGLRGRGGVYHLRSKNAVADLPPGSVVLFRYGKVIVGEAVVQKDKEIPNDTLRDKTLFGESADYEAQVTFAPSSIRLYAPPLHVNRLQEHIKSHGLDTNILQFAGGTPKLTWEIYACVLQGIAERGSFIS